MTFKIQEGAELGDLARLVKPVLHIDKFKSKMGEDTDIVVLTMSVKFKEPAADLVDFIEKGFIWVLDADVSTGELPNGDFAVFVELERNKQVPEYIVTLITDLQSLVSMQPDEWTWTYGRSTHEHPLTVDALTENIPLSVDAYTARFHADNSTDEINKLQEAAGIAIKKKAAHNAYTQNLKIAAGII